MNGCNRLPTSVAHRVHVAGVAWLLALLGGFVPTAHGAEGARNVLVCIGDSTTKGQGLDLQKQAFCNRVAQRSEYEVINLGCGGSTSRDWSTSTFRGLPGGRISCMFGGAWALVDREVDFRRVGFVHILLGYNDAAGTLETCTSGVGNCPLRPPEYRGNLEVMIEKIPPDVIVLLTAPQPPPGWKKMRAKYFRAVGYANMIEKVISLYPNVCRGLAPDVLDARDFPNENDVHFSGSGHEKMSEAMVARMKELESFLPLPAATPNERFRKLCK